MNTKYAIGILPVLMALCMAQTTPAPPTTISVTGTAGSGLTKTGTGTLTLTSGEGYSGRTAIQPGTLIIKGITEDAAFGAMPDNSPVKLYTLTNAHGLQARICTYGGTIDGVKVPDAKGNFTNVVACADTFQTLRGFSMQAQTIGRVANRIAGGKFTIDGKDYTVGTGNVLHSGNTNFGTKNWQGKALPATDHSAACELTITSKDGDGGFPGNFTLTVTYTLTDDNELKLEYAATTDKTTPVNVTNHAYWNLAGAPGWGNAAAPQGRAGAPAAGPLGIAQEVWIDADKYLPADAGNIPTGQLAPVKDTPFDFTKPTLLNARTADLAKLTPPARNFDHAFVLNATQGGKLALAARLRDPASGRTLEISTDQPGLMLYTGQAAGVALETQHHPDSLHHDNFPTTLLKAGDTFKTTTVYTFSAK